MPKVESSCHDLIGQEPVNVHTRLWSEPLELGKEIRQYIPEQEGWLMRKKRKQYGRELKIQVI